MSEPNEPIQSMRQGASRTFLTHGGSSGPSLSENAKPLSKALPYSRQSQCRMTEPRDLNELQVSRRKGEAEADREDDDAGPDGEGDGLAQLHERVPCAPVHNLPPLTPPQLSMHSWITDIKAVIFCTPAMPYTQTSSAHREVEQKLLEPTQACQAMALTSSR